MNIELDILRYVKEHKIPMVKVAQAAGMTPQNIKKSIGNNPKGDTVTNIANGLGVHPSVFFYDKDEENESTAESDTKQNEETSKAEEGNKPKSEINLRKLMQKLGLGTNAFAEKCGMSSQSMSQFLRNKSLTTNTIYRIAVALDIDPREMFFPTEEKDDLFSNADKNENKETAEAKPAYPVHENGLMSENQQQGEMMIPASSMMQAETFCPHCGTRVKLGVVMIQESK